MNEPVYTPNSNKYKEQQKEAVVTEKRVQKVTKNPVKTKKNELRKFADVFISEDISTVKNYLIVDVIVPALKKLAYDVVVNGFDTFLYGTNGRTKTTTNSSKVRYSNFYEQRNNTNSNNYHGPDPVKSNNSLNYDDIVFGSRGEAEAAKQQLMEIIARYGVATVSDLFEMTPNLTAPYTANKYGWMDVSNVEVTRVRDGYTLKLPKAVAID